MIPMALTRLIKRRLTFTTAGLKDSFKVEDHLRRYLSGIARSQQITLPRPGLVKDYTVYLVATSGRNHPSRTLSQTIEEAIQGGTGVVQLREKELSEDKLISLAKEIHSLTKKYGIPLIINDSIEALLATDAEGLHVGQGDTPCSEARRRIGPNKIIGVSIENPEQARKAIEDGADYIGIQICYPSRTKPTNGPFLGHIGVREILESIPIEIPIKTVAIGGIQPYNVRRLISTSSGSNGRTLDGVAVVSAITNSENPESAATTLLQEVNLGRNETKLLEDSFPWSKEDILKSIPALLLKLRQKTPLVHHITNYVVMNDTANSTLALGGSPIMSYEKAEAEDLSKSINSVVLNIGTLTEPLVHCMVEAGKHANSRHKPVIFDPVGAGATILRRDTTRHILNSVHVDIIKGNAAEIYTVADIVGCASGKDEELVTTTRGVDSISDPTNAAEIVRAVAKRELCVVAMTGAVDYVSDGKRTVAIENGHAYQHQITGSGCMAAAAIAAFAGISQCDHFTSAVAGLLCMNIAAEHAAKREDVRGPGTFRSAFIDEIKNLSADKMLSEFKISIIQ